MRPSAGRGLAKLRGMAQSALARLIFSAHLLRCLAEATRGGRTGDARQLASMLGVNDDELGAGLASLRAEGFVETERLCLTPQGAAFANDLCKRRLALLRRAVGARPAAAAA